MIAEIVLLGLACLLLPLAWGWLVHRLYTRMRLHRLLPGPSEPPSGVPLEPTGWDYQI